MTWAGTIWTIFLFGSAGPFHPQEIPAELFTPDKTIVETTGLPADDRHDPSNIIYHRGTYYMWCTHHVVTEDQPYDAFQHTQIHLYTSQDGLHWRDQGLALEKGGKGDLDEKGALTAYVVPHEKKFYMFYSAIPGTFDNALTSKRGISAAIADRPEGPWEKTGKKILWAGDDGCWDELMAGDANLIRKDGKWWFYYKSKQFGASALETMLGLAIGDSLLGPYRKHEANPLMKAHAFSAWKHRDGIALVGGRNAEQHVFWSTDGIHFQKAGPFQNKSTGFFCPANFTDRENEQGVSWGVDVTLTSPRRIFRFDCDLKVNP
jgi:hypothetical protein